MNSKLIDRIPREVEEVWHYRKHYLLAKTIPFDVARWLPPSPTLEVHGVRIGSDKLSHFFSQGWWYYKWWKKNRNKFNPEELQRNMIRYGVRTEWMLVGMLLTGIFSLADLEANYQGFRFYHSLCNGGAPLFYLAQGRWHFSGNFDFRNYVTPEWDESYHSNIYSRLRWKWIRPTLAAYCPLWRSKWVAEQQARYRLRDTQTSTEKLVADLVAEGELDDPGQFGMSALCGGSGPKALDRTAPSTVQ